MTLIKKLLTASLPVALVGVVTPTIVSCSCHKDSYSYEYGDHINCLDKSDGDYHKRKDIANAAKAKAYREPQGKISLATANGKLTGKTGGQFAFNDLIASLVIIAEKNMNLKKGWTYNDTTYKIQCDLTYGEELVHIPSGQDLTFSYIYDDDQFKLVIDNALWTPIRSYAFYDCTLVARKD